MVLQSIGKSDADKFDIGKNKELISRCLFMANDTRLVAF